MLLRNVLAAFLDNLPNERALDLPFLALLADMGFEDVHFTHGPAEFGKDFIAKRRDDGQLTQYSFQSKGGDVAQGGWRSEVMPQMLEAVVSGLSHPRFDSALPHQAVLVLSGRLKGNAPLGFQDLNRKLETEYRKRPIDLWDRERLVEYFLRYGPDAFYAADAGGVEAFGSFLTEYGAAMRGELTVHAIELHSRTWLQLASPERRFEAALETELLAAACIRSERLYEAVVCLLAQLRTTLAALSADQSRHALLRDIHRASLFRLAQLADEYVKSVSEAGTAGGDLLGAIGGAAIVTYPLECARALEMCALSYFLGDGEQRARAESSLVDVLAEEGCWHPLSDRYAVVYVLAVLALVSSGHPDKARALVHRVALWVADRYEQGAGRAEFDASPTRELEFLLGYPFEGVGVEPRTASLLATALCDLSAFLGDPIFFSDVVNEFMAVDVAFEYFQASDTAGQFRIDGVDVLQFPNIEYNDSLGAFTDLTFANHVTNEARSLALAGELGPGSYAALMLLLRDRYFPSLWVSLAASRAQGATSAGSE